MKFGIGQSPRSVGDSRPPAGERRRPLLRPDDLPPANGLGLTFDAGEFPAARDLPPEEPAT